MMLGGCRCGALRYTLAGDGVPPVYCCHCSDCQSWTGSAFSEQAMLGEDMLAVTGPVVDYIYENRSGAQSHQRVCGTCHTRIFNTNSRWAGVVLLRAGTLDDSARIAPRAHIWTASKQPWVALPEGVPSFPENAPQAEFVAILTAQPT